MRVLTLFLMLLFPAMAVNAEGGQTGVLAPQPAVDAQDPAPEITAKAVDPVAENAARLAQEALTRTVFYAPAAPDLRPRARRTAAIAAGPPADMARIGAIRPKLRELEFPRARWQNKPEGMQWTRAAVSALKTHGKPLTRTVPQDIDAWCPAYRNAGDKQRRAFWVGFLSALAKHESTWRPDAVGGGGLWYGLLQILPGTARGYRCHARTGEELKNGAANLSCAIRIMSVTVPRDRAIAVHNGRWRGVAADWGPMVSDAKRKEMAAWTARQSYCKPLSSTRPRARPEGLRG